MFRTKPSLGLTCVAMVCAVLSVAPPLLDNADAANRSKARRSTEQRLNMQQAVALAVTRNLRMADDRLAVREKEHQRREAFSDFLPSIDLQYSATAYRYKNTSNIAAFAAAHDGRRIYGQPPVVNGVYPYRIDPYKAFTLTATVSQPLYTGGRLLNDYKYARLGVDYSAIQYEVDRQDLILEVYQAYNQMTQSIKLLEVADQSIRALEALRNQTREFYKAGVVPKVDVLSTEGQLAQARIQKTQAQADIERYRATLNFLLRYPQETPLQIDPDISFVPSDYSIPQIYATAAANRLEIRQANISVEQAMALVKSAKADLIPAIALQVQGSRTNDDWNPLDREAINSWNLQGILTWSFDMFRRRETVKDRRASQARAFVAREQLVEQIMDEVKTAYIDMKRSQSDIGDNRKAVEFRRENFRINQERYKEQVATYIEVLDAQRQLAQAEGDYYLSLIGYRINKATLERRMGILRE